LATRSRLFDRRDRIVDMISREITSGGCSHLLQATQ
jgi:hypothetical protein